MKRRNFIQATGLAALGTPLYVNGMNMGAVEMSPLFTGMDPDTDKVMVIIQLNGGYDGLNVVLPLDQYSNLSKARANILIPEDKALKLGNNPTALHPIMTGMQKLFKDGKMSVVHSVGYPNQNRSHFRSTDIWESASSANEYLRTGWIGRYFEKNYPTFPDGYPSAAQPHPFALTMSSTVSETCQGTIGNFSLTLNDPFAFGKLTEGKEKEAPNSPYGQELSFLRTSISQTNAYSTIITDAAKKGKNLVTYPTSSLATQLKNIALMISGGLKTKVYVARLGGFDTHANQVSTTDTTKGVQAELLKLLSEAISAFQEDLRLMKVEERVIGMTFSEFGRQIKSNAAAGTDHGTAAPLFIFGSCVNKQIIGKNPEIPETVASQAGVPMQIDFRDVYGSLLMGWFGVSETTVKSYLYNNFTLLPLVKNCALSTDANDITIEDISVKAYPNPFRDQARIEFELNVGAYTRVSIFDMLGSELSVLSNQQLPSGKHQFDFNGSHLPAGTYICRVQAGSEVMTLRVIKY